MNRPSVVGVARQNARNALERIPDKHLHDGRAGDRIRVVTAGKDVLFLHIGGWKHLGKDGLAAHRDLPVHVRNEWIGLPESGRKGGNGVTLEGHGVVFQRHSSFWAEPALVTLYSCPL